jgi:AraC-like DNA-binding protein
MADVPEGWAYKVLYVEPGLLQEWSEREAAVPRAARWVVFRDLQLRAALLAAHSVLASEPPGLAVDEAVLEAVQALRPHLRPGPAEPARGRAEHAAVRRARLHLGERFDQRVPLAELAAVACLSRFGLVRRFRQVTGLSPTPTRSICASLAPGRCWPTECPWRRSRPTAAFPISRICLGPSSAPWA